MKKVVVACWDIIRIHNYNDTAVYATRVERKYIGSAWGARLDVRDDSFSVVDDNGNYVFIGDTRDLHARIGNDRTFEGGYAYEFNYMHISDVYTC